MNLPLASRYSATAPIRSGVNAGSVSTCEVFEEARPYLHSRAETALYGGLAFDRAPTPHSPPGGGEIGSVFRIDGKTRRRESA